VVKISEDQPNDRYTRLCDDMFKVMEASPNYRPGDKAVVFVVSESHERGGAASFGFEEEAGALLVAIVQQVFGPAG
jgi:hypothetical protein